MWRRWAHKMSGQRGSDLMVRSNGGGWLQTPVAGNWQAIAFADANNGVAVAGFPNGNMVRTIDGGQTWTVPATSCSGWHDGVAMYTSAGAASVGSSGLICGSSNGGQDWTRVTEGPVSHVHDVSFGDADTGYMLLNGTYYKTVDRGESWERAAATYIGGGANAIHFVDADHGWVAVNSTVSSTSDGGDNWLYSVPTGDAVYDVFFIDQTTGWAVGDGPALMRSTNGGKNWSPPDSQDPGAPPPFAVHFADANNGWAAGAGGYVFTTSDGGLSWSLRSVAQSGANLVGVFLSDANTGWVVGNGGEIHHSNDGGLTWTEQTSSTYEELHGVWFLDNHRGYVVGYGGTILNTVDGGATWNQQPTIAHQGFTSISVPTPGLAFVGGTKGAVLRGESPQP